MDDWKKRVREVKLRQLPSYGRELLRRMMPESLSFLARHPVWGPRIPGIDGLLEELDLLEVCALQWRMCVEAACQYGRSLPADRYLELRLEALSAESITPVLAFCGLGDEPALHEYLRDHFDRRMPGARTAAADPAEIEVIERWIEPTLQWLGQA